MQPETSVGGTEKDKIRTTAKEIRSHNILVVLQSYSLMEFNYKFKNNRFFGFETNTKVRLKTVIAQIPLSVNNKIKPSRNDQGFCNWSWKN